MGTSFARYQPRETRLRTVQRRAAFERIRSLAPQSGADEPIQPAEPRFHVSSR